MAGTIHLIKLSVGSESVEQIEDWQKNRSKQRLNGQYYHLTRMWPKREKELINGGSIYWVVKGFLQARQRIIGLEEMIGDDGIRRCAILLDPALIRTATAPKRPFQGWRYLKPEDAPPDLGQARENDDTLPPELAGALAEIGVL
ncbi:DUF1489 domain-containing protein [Marivita sp. S6314]|uniref:DUF1489 family protein n=1 Tax=Marivita sp. S6314 TaxID=2926406 RepID=UPI001FF2F473|nr:DUF1489 domain-containing protein [Marivita sp. S6314]MCK0149688.1 DUF1489 domain-containing protein [Marivita sp. S6314]